MLFDELKSLNNPWLIIDFITVGSPLCHGAILWLRIMQNLIVGLTTGNFR